MSTEKWRERRWRLFSTVPLWVCSACAVARQIHEPDLEVGAVMKGMEDYVKAITECDRNLSF
ncbi:MAG: DsrE family protein [Nitrospira sp.]|nr:DsrE family protein [Nitrospira sp.]